MVERSTRMTTPAQVDDRRDSETRYVYSQWRLMWLKLRKHRPAMISLYFLIAVYLVAIFAEFVAPSDPYHRLTEYLLAPPVRVRFVDADGGFSLRPFVYGLTRSSTRRRFCARTCPTRRRRCRCGSWFAAIPTSCGDSFPQASTSSACETPTRRSSCWGATAKGEICCRG